MIPISVLIYEVNERTNGVLMNGVVMNGMYFQGVSVYDLIINGVYMKMNGVVINGK